MVEYPIHNMTQTNTVSIKLNVATAIGARMRTALEKAAGRVSSLRWKAGELRQLGFENARNPEIAKVYYEEAKTLEMRASISDDEFKQLEIICIELTKAGA